VSEPEVISVTDHGVWRGKRSWTVVIDGPTGRAQVSAHGRYRGAAVADALNTYRARRVFTDDERAAMRRTSAALNHLSIDTDRKL
jgi:hypothetical protein